MGTSKLKVLLIFGLVTSLIRSSAYAGASQYHWWNGSEKVELEMIPNFIVDFSPENQNQEGSPTFKVISQTKVAGGARILKLNKNDFSMVIKMKGLGQSKRSPLFHQGSDIRGLAGGLMVTFNENITEEQIKTFCASRGLRVINRYNLYGQAPMWFLDSPVGLESLSLANELKEKFPQIIEKAEPNFWQPLDTRVLKSVQRPNSKANQENKRAVRGATKK